MSFRRILSGVIFFVALTAQSHAKDINTNQYQLMLVGSDLPFCRSGSLQLCDAAQLTKFDVTASRNTTRYKVSPRQIELVMNKNRWLSTRQAFRHDLKLVLRMVSKKNSGNSFTREQLLRQIKQTQIYNQKRKISGYSMLAELSNDERNMVFDFLEVAQISDFNLRLKEKVNILDPSYANSLTMFKQMVHQAKLVNGHKKPRILLVTAADRDPYKNVDSLLDVFSQLNADVSWLPIDNALSSLLNDNSSCELLDGYRNSIGDNYAREHVYPDLTSLQFKYCQQPALIKQDLEQADAIIFSGDSPQYLRQTFIDTMGQQTDLLKIIQSKMLNNKLFIAAYGAATLAMPGGKDLENNPVATVVEGSSENVFLFGTQTDKDCFKTYSCHIDNKNSVYYQPNGGLSLFSIGILDIDSRRGNLGRVSKVSYDNNNRFGFNLEAMTALLVNKKSHDVAIEIIGFGGLMLVDHANTLAQKNNRGLNGITLAYLTPQDKVTISKGKINFTYPQWKKTPANFDGEQTKFSDLFIGNNFTKFSQQSCLTSNNQWQGYAGRRHQFKIHLKKDQHSQIKVGGTKVDNQFKLYCSFNRLILDVVKQ